MPATDKKTGRLVTSLAFFSWGLSMLARTAFGYYLEPLGTKIYETAKDGTVVLQLKNGKVSLAA